MIPLIRHCIPLIIFSLAFRICYAQKEGNTWYFGSYAGVDFNSGSPVALTNSGMYDFEGCASISDPATGSILFYSNGNQVWNANHTVMANGSGLTGDQSSAQAAVIVPDPGNADQYYIFTAGEYYTNGNDGYRYSIVDISLNGGLGDVTATKNVLLYSPACEKLCAVKNAAGDGFWIMTHEWSGNNFVAFELTASGLSSGVTSSAGTSYSSYNPIGCMKFSSDGMRLATVLSGLNEAEVFDFDAATGVVSNSFTVGPIAQTFPYVYGISFSPNGSRLYVTEENDNHIYQYDLNAGTVAEINASKTAVGSSGSNAMQTIQLAPDGKLYIARNGAGFLAVINDPDSLGTLCNFEDDGFYPGGQMITYGLPGFVESIIIPDTTNSGGAAFAVSDTSVCQKFCIDFSDVSTNNPTSWSWTFEGGSPPLSSSQNPSACYNLPGTFDVTLIACNGIECDTVTLTDFITVIPTPPAPIITISNDTLFSSEGLTYQWQLNGEDIAGATSPFYVYSEPGSYTVFVTDENGCPNYASVVLTGIDNSLSGTDWNIYPNPSNGTFVLSAYRSESAMVEIEITNAIGQRVYFLSEGNISNSFSKEISLRNVSRGIYFLTIRSARERLTRRIEVF